MKFQGVPTRDAARATPAGEHRRAWPFVRVVPGFQPNRVCGLRAATLPAVRDGFPVNPDHALIGPGSLLPHCTSRQERGST